MSDYKSEEEILGKAYDAKLMKRLLSYIKPYKNYVIFAILLNVVVAALGPIRPYLTKIAVDDYIANSDYNGLLLISLALFGSLLFQAVIQYFLTYFTQYLGQKTLFDLRTQIFNHIQKLALKFFDKTPIGRLVTRATNDVEALGELFSSGIVMVFSDIFIILWILGFMFFMDFSLVTCNSFCAACFNLWYLFVQKKSKRKLQRCKTSSCKIKFLYAGTCNRYERCSDF